MLTGLYIPGDSVVHGAPVWAKFLTLTAVTTLLVVFASPVTITAGAVVLGGAYALAGLGPRVLLRQVAPLRWFLIALVPLHVWSAGWEGMIRVTGTLVLTVVAASLVTLTTRIEDMIDALVVVLGRLRRFGVDPERVALLVALTIRAIPVLTGLVEQSRQARAARGMERSVRALVTPTAVRSVRYAQQVGEALAARGVDD